jgi:hypothetical protein
VARGGGGGDGGLQTSTEKCGTLRNATQDELVRPAVGSCDHNDELPSSVRGEEFPTYLSEYQLLKKHFKTWNCYCFIIIIIGIILKQRKN